MCCRPPCPYIALLHTGCSCSLSSPLFVCQNFELIFPCCCGRPLFLSEYGALKLTHLLVQMGDPIGVSGSGLRKSLHFVRTRTPRPAHPSRHPSQSQAVESSSGEVSSSGEEEQHAANVAVLKRGGKEGAGEVGYASGGAGGLKTGADGAAGAAVEEQGGSDKGREKKEGSKNTDGAKPNDHSVPLEGTESDLLAPLIHLERSQDDGLGTSGGGCPDCELGGAESEVRRRSMERIEVVDLLSGEALGPRKSELWSFQEERRPCEDSDEGSSSLQYGGDKVKMGPDAWPSAGDEFPEGELEMEGGGSPLQREEETTEEEEDEEQQGWRMRSRGTSFAGAETSPVKQPDVYWQMLRTKKGESKNVDLQRSGGAGARGSKDSRKETAETVSDGYNSPGTPNINESR
jgi:hypothetical protein